MPWSRPANSPPPASTVAPVGDGLAAESVGPLSRLPAAVAEASTPSLTG